MSSEAQAFGVPRSDAERAEPLGIALITGSEPPEDIEKLWYDISGFTIISRFGELFDLRGVDLSDIRYVKIWVAEGETVYELGFSRTRVSARNPHQLLVLMIVVGLFMVAISFIFLRNQLRPIRRLAPAAAVSRTPDPGHGLWRGLGLGT